MKGDFSKNTFNVKKHFHDVLMQQGRVMLDSDWNEQGSITSWRVETGTKDIVGASGAPINDAGFGISPVNPLLSPPVPANIQISAGHFYVDGILCENDDDVLFADQPDFNGTPLPSAPDTYVFYLDAWLRHITAVENPDIREVALGGPDTTTRTRLVWQVKFYKSATGENCLTTLPDEVLNTATGKLAARSEKDTVTNDPCGLTESGGYRRLVNQLYRVEIHVPGNRSKATFKWSRDNGSVIVKWEQQDPVDPDKLTVSNTGRDELLGFKAGDWIELVDERTDLLNLPGVLAELAKVDGNVLTIKKTSIRDPENPAATSVSINNRVNPRIRRWDSAGDLKMNSNASTWISLEEGVEVNFTAGNFKSGDYWMIPARTAKADIEWPFTEPQLPQGILHHFSKLAILRLDATGWTLLSDCRQKFPPLSELISLFYLGGDGQEAMPGLPLPYKLIVGVANGKWPVANAQVKFEVTGGGIITPANGGLTDVNGIAECAWTIGTDIAQPQTVQATLLDAANNAVHLPVTFSAGFSLASNVLYDGTGCDNWGNQPHNTVAEAITALCMRESGKGCTVTVGREGQFPDLKTAFKVLEKSDAVDICICLMPQREDHILDDLKVKPKRTIKIIGCGSTINMVGDQLSLTAEKIIFNGFTIVVSKNANAQIILTAIEVLSDHCTFTSILQGRKDPFVIVNNLPGARVIKDAIVHLEANYFFASVALALGIEVGGWIKNNLFSGSVLLQYKEDGFFPLKWPLTISNQDVEKLFLQNLKINHNSDVLHVCNNVLINVATNSFSGTDIPLDILAGKTVTVIGYQSVIVSENIFYGPRSSFLGLMVSLSNNHFLPANDNIACFALGQRGIVSGNIDPVFNNDGGLMINTLFTRKIIVPNLILVK